MDFQMCIPRDLVGSLSTWNISSEPFLSYNTSYNLLPVTYINEDPSNHSIIATTSNHLSESSTRKILKHVIVPLICAFGIVGNILTLFILSRKRVKSTCDRTERTVHISLSALAVSDLLLCLSLLPHGVFHKETFAHETLSFQLVYRTYGAAFINTMILTSTWLTVTMALSRYLAIVHTFKVKHLIGATGTKISVLCVFIICVLFNVPRFFMDKIESLECIDGTRVFFKTDGYFKTSKSARKSYVWIYFTFGIFLPLALLAFSNICLVRTLWKSTQLRKRYRVPAAHVDSNQRITSILVTVVLMYIFLVTPAEILLFLQERLSDLDKAPPDALPLAIEVTNILQTVNFSCNFFLYFILNVHFRKALRDMVCRNRICYRNVQPKYKRGGVMIHRTGSLRGTTQTSV